MDIYYTDFLNILESLHDKIKELIASQPQQALDWSPQPGVGSLNMIVSHVAGAERYWIGEVVGCEQPAGRPGMVYRVTGLNYQELCQRLDDALSCCRKVLEKSERGDLDERRISPRNGREVTVRWSLQHVMQHTANHQREIIFILQFGKAAIFTSLWKKQPRNSGCLTGRLRGMDTRQLSCWQAGITLLSRSIR